MSKQEALPPWAEIQKKTFTNWVNVHLSERGLRIENLASDLSDGLKLINLLEQIASKRLPKYTKVVKFHNQKLENVGIALKFLKDEGLKLVAIGPEDVVECRIKLILGLIWTIILRWQIQKISYSEGSPGPGEKGGDSKAELLAWVNRVVPKFPVKNLNKDWQDGKTLAALTNYLRPGSVPIRDGEEPIELITKAVTAAEKLKVHAVISPEDIISPHLDDLSMMTYVSMFREREAQLKAPDATKFEAYGLGLTGPVARKKNKFVVVSKNSEGTRLGSGGLLISSKYASQDQLKQSEPAYLPTKVKDNRNGESPGEYVIYVTWQEFNIAGSPFTVNVAEPTVISAEESSVDPEPKEYIISEEKQDSSIPKKFYFLVTTRNNDGTPVTRGGASLVSAIFPENGGDEIDSIIEDLNDGTYKVIFAEPGEGEYSVVIGIAGDDGENVLEHVSGSPFTFYLTSSGEIGSKPDSQQQQKAIQKALLTAKPKVVASINPKKSVVETYLLTKPDGKKFFKVITKDDSGAQVYVPNTILRAKLSPVTKGPYYLISRLNNLVLTLPDNKNAPNEYVLTWAKKSGNANQLWYFTAEGGVENAKTGLVLDVSPDGTKIIVQSKKSRPEQGWAYNPVTEILTSKRPASSGKGEGNFALDIQNAKKQAGVNAVIFSKRHQNNNKSQRWYLNSVNKAPQSAPPPAIATFFIVSRLHGYVLGTAKPVREEGIRVVLSEKKPVSDDDHAYQLWKFTPDGFVQNVATGYVLDLQGDPEASAQLVLSSRKPKDNTAQKWKYNPITELLQSDKEEELVVNVDGDSKKDGAFAVLLPKKSGKAPSQNWYLVPASKGDNAVVPNVAANVPVEFVDNQDGSYECVFAPEVAGKYDVSVGLAADDTPGEEEGPLIHFDHSPFVTEISPATEVSAANSTVSAIPAVLPNGDRVFQVTLKDKDGKNIPFSGVPIVANIFAKRPNGKEEPVPVSIVDLGNGVYDVVVKPTAGTGDYSVDVGLPKDADHPDEIGVHIDGPFDVKIDLASDLDPTHSTVDRTPLARLDPSELAGKSRRRPSKGGRKGKGKGKDDQPSRGGRGDDEGVDKREDDLGESDEPSSGAHGDEPSKSRPARSKAKAAKAPKAPKRTKGEDESDSDSSSSSSSSSSSDSDSDKEKDINDEEPHRRKRKQRPSSDKDVEEKPDFVRRVWKARAKDSEGNPLHHGGAPIAARAKDADGNALPVTVEDNNDGTYDVVVTIPSSDDLVPVSLDVGLSNNLQSAPPGEADISVAFGDTPFTAQVDTNDNNVVPEALLELDLAPKFTHKTNLPYFVARSVDKFGNPLKKGGLPVVAQLANLEDVPAELEGVLERLADADDKEALLLALANSKPENLKVKDKKDGTYRIVLNDPLSGDFVLDLGLGNPKEDHPSEVLDRSPELPVLVSIDLGDTDALGDLDITQSEADLSNFGEDQLADGSIYFPVITKDSNGDLIPIGGAPIGAAVSVSGRKGEKAVPTKVIDHGDGTYTVAFIPKKLPGTYSIAVGLEDEDGNLERDKANQIKDFPLLVKLGPGIDDTTSPLARAADAFEFKPVVGHQPEDGEGGIGFDIVSKPGKQITPELLDEIGASLAAQILDEDDNFVPVTVHDLGDGKFRVSFRPKPNQKYAVGVALVDPEKNAVEIAGSPFLLEVDPNGEAKVVVAPAGGFQVGGVDGDDNGDNDLDSPVKVQKGGRPTEAAPISSPFDTTSSPYHPIPQRPKYAKAIEGPSPDTTTVEGPGLWKAFPDKEASFAIHPKSAAGSPLSGVSPSLFRVKATGPNGEDARVKLTPNPDGTLTAAYTPKAEGPHTLDVAIADPSTGKFRSVNGLPVKLDVEPAVSASKTLIKGPGITDFSVPVITKTKSFFIIEAVDPSGNRATTGGEKFVVKIDPPSLLSTIVSFFIRPEVVDNNDGTYTVYYETRDSGKHTIRVKYNGAHVGSSPIELEVEDGTEEEECIAVDYMFTIEARTVKGTPRNRGGDKFVVTIDGPEGPVTDVKVDDLAKAEPSQPGKYRVYYTLPGKGKYVIHATINGKDIKGSPWRQKL